jgi:Ras-related C3 botulinum toxin substrate 1
VISPPSFENISSKWHPELAHHCPTAPILLVGLKVDMRESRETIMRLQEKGMCPITSQQGEAKAKEIGATKYVECSAISQKGVKGVFEDAIRAALGEIEKPKKKKKNVGCILM